MGQHKSNPTAIAYAKGEIRDNRERIGKPESRRRMNAAVMEYLLLHDKAFGAIVNMTEQWNNR